jgi:hypothetical protein
LLQALVAAALLVILLPIHIELISSIVLVHTITTLILLRIPIHLPHRLLVHLNVLELLRLLLLHSSPLDEVGHILHGGLKLVLGLSPGLTILITGLLACIVGHHFASKPRQWIVTIV